MEIEYWINFDGDWLQVDCDAYHRFKGEKEIRHSTW